MLKNREKIPGSRSGSTWLQKFNQFFLVHRYIRGKIFTKIRSVVFTDRQADNKRRALHNLLGGGNYAPTTNIPKTHKPNLLMAGKQLILRLQNNQQQQKFKFENSDRVTVTLSGCIESGCAVDLSLCKVCTSLRGHKACRDNTKHKKISQPLTAFFLP